MFRIFVVKSLEEIQLYLFQSWYNFIFIFFSYFDDVFEGIASPVMVIVGPPFSLDVLFDFVSYLDDVPTFFLHMDLSVF